MNQLALFEEPKRRGGMPRSVEEAWERAYSAPVQDELVVRINEKVGQWLSWRDFDDIRERHNIGSCMGHALHHLVRSGRVAERHVYYGAERPGMAEPYRGFGILWGSVQAGPPIEHKLRKP